MFYYYSTTTQQIESKTKLYDKLKTVMKQLKYKKIKNNISKHIILYFFISNKNIIKKINEYFKIFMKVFKNIRDILINL